MTITHLTYMKLAGFLLVAVLAFLGSADLAQAQYMTSGPPDAPVCLNGTAGTTYTFSYVGSTGASCAPSGSNGGSCSTDSQVNMYFGNVSYSGQMSVQGTNSWTTPGTYWAYASGPAWSTSSCQGANGQPGGGCSATGGPGSGTMSGPSGSSYGGPAFCKIVITEAPPPVTLPDLIAGAVTPTTVTAGVTTILNATVANVSSVPASPSSITVFQRASDSSGTGATFITSHNTTNLNPNSSTAASGPYAFPTAGVYYVRACADIGNAVAESNEGNNCGPWTTIVANDPVLSASCTVSPTSITTGQSATWTATASGGNGSYLYAWSGSDTLSGTGPSITKTYTTTGTKLASVTVGSGGQSVTVGCTNSVSVGAAPMADLTAGGTSVSGSPTAGNSVTFNATASNIGNATSGSFPTRFQVANASISSTVGNTASGYIALAASASQGVSASYTFASSGTYNVRACANQNSGGTNIVTESNYDNNCGPWTQVSVSSAPPTGSLSCNVSNTNPAPGTTVTYTATPSGGASGPYSWNDSQGGSYGSGASVSRLISGAGPYVMTVDGNNVVSPASCPVVAGACTSPTASISASPTRVREGQTTSVSWSASGVDSSCTVTENGSTLSTVAGVSCNIPNGNATRTITQQTVYRISCDNGEVVDEAIVNLIPGFIEF